MRVTVAVLVAVLASLGAGGVAAGTGKPVTGIAGRDPLTGKFVSLDQWKGRAVAVNVWASWCEGCKAEAKALKAFEAAHPQSVLGIDYNDSRAGARAFYHRYDLEHPSIFDPKGTMVARLKAIGLPTTVFLDRTHTVVYAVAGAATPAQLETGWRKAVATRR